MRVVILSRYTGAVHFTAEIDCIATAPRSIKIGLAAKWALKNGASLSEANLRGANLSGANLSGTDLRRANLSEADLSEANLRGANLSGTDLRGASLSGTDLRRANLSWANLSWANLSGTDLRGTDLREARNIPALAAAQTLIVPEGHIIGWKKCRNGVIARLCVPAEARRSNGTGRKCRAEFADVLAVFGADVGISSKDGRTEYRPGERVACDTWCEDRWQECAGGIHFFLTREEAEAYG